MIHQINFDNYIQFIQKHFSNEYVEKKLNNKYINEQFNIKFKKYTNKDNNIEIIIGEFIKLIIKLKENNNLINNIELEYDKDDLKIYCNDPNYIFIHYKKIYKINLQIHNNNIIELLGNIIKNEENRNRGIGTEGMKKTLNFLKNSGYIKIYGEMSSVDNLERMKRFYSKNGFEISGNIVEFFL